MPNAKTISDALRRLLVVIGCVVLATAQPMSAFAADSAADSKRTPETVIYPKGASEKGAETVSIKTDSGAGGMTYIFLVLLLAGAGAWLLWKRKPGDGPFGNKAERKLHIEETRSLGNRQHLVVASYEGKKFLLGVTQERIELLTHLPDDAGGES